MSEPLIHVVLWTILIGQLLFQSFSTREILTDETEKILERVMVSDVDACSCAITNTIQSTGDNYADRFSKYMF